ncbi:hypothetical protein MML48_3g00008362 [Holotrichia oblita]|uniref:Uncharacterized protein n=2 Tax=Holotrichia oblita TaxID=644536 RepID=A0ACB9TEP0_HOLOL|nr:hypothetical protein MML48_3g00020455 [Holotrichia oblita]KAI4465338.1 hypothetical protein MML48_3g00008362 [Holotrichia oblita]
MVRLTEMRKTTVLRMIGYEDRTRTQQEVTRLFHEKFPDLTPISQRNSFASMVMSQLATAESNTPSTKYDTVEISDLTRDILRKIEQINQKHGYTTRSPVKEFKYFPHFYTYSHQHPKPLRTIINSHGSDEDTKMTQEERSTPKQPDNTQDAQRIKRKITHQQSYILPQKEEPLVQYLMMMPFEPNYSTHQSDFNRYNYLKQIYNPVYNKGEINSANYLEQQMLDNLKNIILKSQLPPNIEGITFNPLVQGLPHENSFVQYRKPDVAYGSSGYINNIPNMPWNVYQYEGYMPDKEIEPASSKSNTPLTLYNSLTTITEYENDEEKCKIKLNQINNDNLRSGKSVVFTPEITQPRYIVDIDKSIEVAAFTENNNPLNHVILLRKENEQNLKNSKITNSLYSDLNNSNNSRAQKKFLKPSKAPIQENNEDEKLLNPVQLFLQHQQQKNKPTPLPTTDENKKDLINEHSKKVLSKDNTGSGIFIHRLKVRKGGVAIAGPGGIATAGSGGTAIVGPNGFAYTHPDSLAIAGTGSRVIAVDPKVNLGDIVKGKEDGNRVGKLVAVGPVIYYNKG